jgi:ParB/RepB/Spo0J family partition protein
MKLPINRLKTENDFNPRVALDRAQVEAIAQSMKTLGQIEPILVRENDKAVINGRHRLAAAKKNGWKFIEANLVKADDVEARILALASNNFGKRLTHLELGKAVYLILEDVKKGKGRRGRIKQNLAKQLGLSVGELKDCLASYRNLNPEARELVCYAVAKQHVLTVEHLREIRQLPGEKQVAILRQVAKAPDATAVDRLVSGFIAAQEFSETPEQTPSSPEIKPREADQFEKNESSTILGLDPVSVDMPWLRYVSAITKCPTCKEDRSVDFSRTKLSSTKDQLPKIRTEMQSWLDENREAA